MAHAFTVGVEEEFQIVDPDTWELRSHVSELLASSAPAFGDQVKREMHQSIVEVGTKICSDVEELAEEIIRNRRDLADAAERVGLRIAAAGTHPFSNWMDQVISPGERYENIVEELQQLARSLLIFGLHVHVAVPDGVVDDRADERGAVLPAAPARAVDQLAVLDGPRHRPEVVPDDGVPALPAHRHPRPLPVVERIRQLRQHARRAALHRQRQEDLVGPAAAADLRHARVPDLRRADGAARRDRDRRARAGDHRQALSAARAAISASAATTAR